MTGVVLCGGKSERMGVDKGLIEQQSQTWAGLTASKLAALKLPVVLSVNEQQYLLYKQKFENLFVIEDDPSINVYGPLKGILSVHVHNPVPDLLVIACDMPAMQTEVIDYLIKTSSEKKEEAFVFRNDSYAEPLCAIYTSACLKKIYEAYTQGQLKKHSLLYVLEKINTSYLPIPNQWKQYFNNYNSPDGLDQLTIAKPP